MRSAIVVGAGPGGLAAAAMLKDAGLAVRVLERADEVGAAWHAHYEGLHLHTAKSRSSLPGLAMPKHYPRFPSRVQVTDYLAAYAQHFDLDIRTATEVIHIAEEGTGWRVDTAQGTERADVVVLATGLNGRPNVPELPGYTGATLHSSAYHAPRDFAGQSVLVVGIGNSGGDIAAELANAGVETLLSVRGGVNIVPKTLLGVPVTSLGLLRRLFGAGMADRLAGPILRAKVGRPEDYGMRQHPKGPIRRLVEDGRVPLIDPGVLPLIRAGKIAVRGAITGAEGREVRFETGPERVDTVIFATGYRVDLRPLLGDRTDVLDDTGAPRTCGEASAARGLFFLGYRAAPEGQLMRLGIEARAIAGTLRT